MFRFRPCDQFNGTCLPCGEREIETSCGCAGCGVCTETLVDFAESDILVSLQYALSSLNQTALSASVSRALKHYYETFTILQVRHIIRFPSSYGLKNNTLSYIPAICSKFRTLLSPLGLKTKLYKMF